MDPFALHIPSVFVLVSPFQVLCAIASIKNLQIEEYKIIIMRGNVHRDFQLVEILNQFGLPYIIQGKLSKTDKIRLFFKPLKRVDNDYKRLFIGDYRQHYALKIGLCNVSCKSDIVYLDDGNITISLLKGTNRITYTLNTEGLALKRIFIQFMIISIILPIV